jgi:hypothetical protein
MCDETKQCSYCKKPVAEQSMDFIIPVCDSEECRNKYYADRRMVFGLMAGIGNRVLV